MVSLSPSTVMIRNSSLFASNVDDEIVMMDESQGRYYALNPVARKIWEYLERARDYDSLLSSLTQAYDVPRERCEADIAPFLQELVDLKLIQIVT